MTEDRITRSGTRARPRRRARHSARVVRRRRQVAACAVVVLLGSVVGVVRAITTDHRAPVVASTKLVGAAVPTVQQTALVAPDVAAAAHPMVITQHGPGTFVTVPGNVLAPGRGTGRSVRVEVESGTDVNLSQFADEVMAILNDPRSWGHGGVMTFERTDGKADIRVLLASPDTSERMCRPLKTHGTESCNIGDAAILTSYRWARGTVEFPNLSVYRQYVVNHEVGHALGHHHETCPGKGRKAPVMQQQTIKVAPCVANGWPFP